MGGEGGKLTRFSTRRGDFENFEESLLPSQS